MDIKFIEQSFLRQFPNGLQDDEFKMLGKKHQSSDRIIKMFKESITIKNLTTRNESIQEETMKSIIKAISQSTLISTFEKVAFKNYIKDTKIHKPFMEALANMLHDCNEDTMNAFVHVCSLKKNETNANIAKWPIVTFFLAYFDPQNEIFIKPTTIKQVAYIMNVDIEYQALPNFNTYKKARKMILDFKQQSSLVHDENNIMVQAIMYTSI